MTNELNRKISPDKSMIITTNSEQKDESNVFVKMSECDEFIGPKRSKHTMVTYGNILYVFGGDNGKHMINDLITYDCTNNSWGRALNGSPPTPRYHHSAIVYNSSMFIFGGFTGDLNSNSNLCNKNDLYEYRFLSGTWHLWNTENPMPSPRSAHGAVCYDHKMWIFAGYGNARLNDMWCIPLNAQPGQNKCWTEIQQNGDQPPTVCNFTVAVIQDSMYLFSGQSGAKTSNHLFKFDFKTLTWSKISSNYILRSTSSPPERRSGHIMVAHENCLYIYGGVLGNNFFHDLHSFDLETKTWNLISLSQNTPIPSGRSFMAASVHGEFLYIFGGNRDQNSRSNELYRYKLPTQPKCTLKDDYFKLLQKESFCDLHFLVGDEVIKAHCAIVACRSAYFRQLIKSSIEKKNSNQRAFDEVNDDSNENEMCKHLPFNSKPENPIEIKINEKCSSASFKILLEFIYTDRIVSLEGKENEIETLKLMIVVYNLSNTFSILKLAQICKHFIVSTISCQNVLELLSYCDRLNLSQLKEDSMRFIIKDSNFNQIIMSKEFETLDQNLMVEIIRRHQVPQRYQNDSTASLNDSFQSEKYQTFEQDFEVFYKQGLRNEFADIVLLVENDKKRCFYAHKCILAARCAYFESYFRSFMPKDNKVKLKIGDTVPPVETCISLLKYIYYGEIRMPPKDALYLFSASHFFQFNNARLQVFCTQNLEANISQENVFDILDAADRTHAIEMKNFALKIIRDNFSELAYSQNIEKLSKELLLDIIRDIGEIYPKILNSKILRSSQISGNQNQNLLVNGSLSLSNNNSTSQLFSSQTSSEIPHFYKEDN